MKGLLSLILVLVVCYLLCLLGKLWLLSRRKTRIQRTVFVTAQRKLPLKSAVGKYKRKE
ncbi:high mobility group protein Z [Symbiopectobacterium purcellii]|uniref:High mobility group protein Z n=1 Tax=Symbiopectobacterium purcellii TaxID=2871826 RepID=A0ABX9AMS7_9ENTR|nr:high mobility group protein Z [Symbiopectobacterium purcellii]QZN95611.1 high mobility group protein Z [Symbiopectobacterium purcellii]